MAMPPGEPRRRRMERGERREAILAAARDVLSGAVDADGVAIEDIAEHAGVSRALVYEYFGDRAKLLGELRSRLAGELAEQVKVAVADASDEHVLLTELAGVHLRFAEAGIGTYRLARAPTTCLAAEIAAHLGDGDHGRLIAAATIEGLGAFAIEWATGSELDRTQAITLIVSFLEGGLRAARPLGAAAER